MRNNWAELALIAILIWLFVLKGRASSKWRVTDPNFVIPPPTAGTYHGETREYGGWTWVWAPIYDPQTNSWRYAWTRILEG